MPYRIHCPHCDTVGLVRVEHVISGRISKTDYYCGKCEYQWQGAQMRRSPTKPRAARRKNRRES